MAPRGFLGSLFGGEKKDAKDHEVGREITAEDLLQADFENESPVESEPLLLNKYSTSQTYISKNLER